MTLACQLARPRLTTSEGLRYRAGSYYAELRLDMFNPFLIS